jgi:thymidylate kinase
MVVIVVSGINGCGKTTFCDQLKTTFIELGIETVYVKTPDYQTETGRLLQRWMQGLEPDISYA